jgi:hypothetical protein
LPNFKTLYLIVSVSAPSDYINEMTIFEYIIKRIFVLDMIGRLSGGWCEKRFLFIMGRGKVKFRKKMDKFEGLV